MVGYGPLLHVINFCFIVSFSLTHSSDCLFLDASHLWETTSDSDFTLVLDCCDLSVSKVEEVDVTSVSASSASSLEVPPQTARVTTLSPQTVFLQKLMSVPSSRWREQHQLFSQCSRAPRAQDGGQLCFHTDRWSLQVRKRGVASPQEFPRALRISYETRPTGGSVRWTKDQDNRCVSAFNTSHLQEDHNFRNTSSIVIFKTCN